MAKAKSKYVFDWEYQADVLHLALRSGTFLREGRGALDKEYFKDPCHVILAEEILDHFDNYGSPPSRGALQEALRKKLTGTKGAVTLPGVRKILREVWDRRNVNPDLVGKEVRRFAAESKVAQILAKTEEFFEDDRHEEWREELDKALMLKSPEPASVKYARGLAERLKSYRGGWAKARPIASQIRDLDKCLLGGLGRQEMGLILGLKGTGKTHTLVTLGAAALENDLTVYHYTLEVGILQLLLRYDRRLARMDEKAIAKKYRKVTSLLKDKDLRLFWYKSNSLAVSTIRSQLHRLGPPDLLIVDYGRLLRPEMRRASRWEEIGSIYEQLRDLGVEFDCGVWTAAQANRQAFGKVYSEGDYITQEHLADAVSIADPCDVIVSFNQTVAEKADYRARLWIDKLREGGGDKRVVKVYCDWSRSLLE